MTSRVRALEYYAALILFEHENTTSKLAYKNDTEAKEAFGKLVDDYVNGLIPYDIDQMLAADKIYTLTMYPFLPLDADASDSKSQLAQAVAQEITNRISLGLVLFMDGKPTRTGDVLLRQVLIEGGDWGQRYDQVLKFLLGVSKNRQQEIDLRRDYANWMSELAKHMGPEVESVLRMRLLRDKTPGPAPPKDEKENKPPGGTPERKDTGSSSASVIYRYDESTGILRLGDKTFQLNKNNLGRLLEEDVALMKKYIPAMSTKATPSQALKKLCELLEKETQKSQYTESVYQGLHHIIHDQGRDLPKDTNIVYADFARKLNKIGMQHAKKNKDLFDVWQNPAKFESRIANAPTFSDPLGAMVQSDKFQVRTSVNNGWIPL